MVDNTQLANLIADSMQLTKDLEDTAKLVVEDTECSDVQRALISAMVKHLKSQTYIIQRLGEFNMEFLDMADKLREITKNPDTHWIHECDLGGDASYKVSVVTGLDKCPHCGQKRTA